MLNYINYIYYRKETIYMQKRGYKNLYEYKALVTIIVINIMLILLLAYIGYCYIFISELDNIFNNNLEVLLGIITIVVLVSSYKAIKDADKLKKIRVENSYKNKMIKQTEDLNKKLRAQRHDFLNHLQVVYSLIEMNEHKEAGIYIEKVYQDIQKINNIMKTSKTPINALLQAKVADCENKNIDILINISSNLNKLIVPSWEMCRVLGNIIDNAIDATKNLKKGLIKLNIYENLDSYIFIIKNNGQVIPDNIIHKIFYAGFTTKGENGEGMGLFITKEIVGKYNGKITLNRENGTCFKIIIPIIESKKMTV